MLIPSNRLNTVILVSYWTLPKNIVPNKMQQPALDSVLLNYKLK